MMNSPIIVDADLSVLSYVKTPQTVMARRAMEEIARRGHTLYAPGLWWFEITSVIHRYLYMRLISAQASYHILELLTIHLGVQRVEVPMRSAFDWATRLHRKAAYDGFYLAAAEQLGAELWSGDQSLVNNARETGITWIHWMGEVQ
jgi:predicted nucleic acid-binding protein